MGLLAAQRSCQRGSSFFILVLSPYEGDFARFFMQTPEVDAIAGKAPQDEQLDLILPSLFLSAATVIIAMPDPSIIHSKPDPLRRWASSAAHSRIACRRAPPQHAFALCGIGRASFGLRFRSGDPAHSACYSRCANLAGELPWYCLSALHGRSCCIRLRGCEEP